VTTVECNPQTAAVAASGDWPEFVDLRVGDALDVLAGTGSVDLIFADAPGGKSTGLDRTISALGPHGLLMVDDMTPTPHWTGEQRTRQDGVRRSLLTSPLLTSVELDHGSGVILAARRA
jgi:predicted O-methyltransferase YrrM